MEVIVMIQIGADTHKKKHFLIAIKDGAKEVSRLSIENKADGYSQALEWSKSLKDNCEWGLENTGSLGKTFAEFLLEQKETVYEIPGNLTARQRRLGLSKNKTDYKDALAIARNVFIEKDLLVPLKLNPEHSALHALTKERDSLVDEQTRCYNRLHSELLYIKPDYQDLIGDFKGSKAMNKCREFIENFSGSKLSELHRDTCLRLLKHLDFLKEQIKDIEKEISSYLEKLKTPLTSLQGISDIRAAKLLGEIGDISRFKNSSKLAKVAGIAPLEVSSGFKQSHRVNTGGNRQLNMLFHAIALTQKTLNPKAKEYYERKLEEGKTKRMAMRCLKRQLVKVIFSMLKNNTEYKLPEKKSDELTNKVKLLIKEEVA
jgi:transposase